MIIVREYTESDVEEFAELANNKNVAQYLSTTFPEPYTLEDAKWWVNEGCHLGIHKAIEYKNAIVGAVGVNRKPAERYRSGAIGYWIGEPYWGKGFACEALKVLTDRVFSTTNIVRLEANVFGPNIGSKKVAEKAGYHLEATLKKAVFKNDAFYDECVYVKFSQ